MNMVGNNEVLKYELISMGPLMFNWHYVYLGYSRNIRTMNIIIAAKN